MKRSLSSRWKRWNLEKLSQLSFEECNHRIVIHNSGVAAPVRRSGVRGMEAY